jgi:hypothetical protein
MKESGYKVRHIRCIFPGILVINILNLAVPKMIRYFRFGNYSAVRYNRHVLL